MKNFLFTKRLLPTLAALFLAVAAMAQGKVNFTLQGKVTDGRDPLVGVSVVLEGTTIGAVTDFDGKYSISGSANEGSAVFVYSFIGFAAEKKTITLKSGSQNMDVTLREDALGLGEVVVVGSSVRQGKKELGNNMTSIRADQLAKKGTGDVLQAMQGKVAGARITQNSGDPGGGISVTLRGAKSLLGSSEPLYVIDGVVSNNATVNVTNTTVDAGGRGVIGQNRLADLNPNDIESVDIINGAAASAIYGSRASNGVVLITTKRGKSGKPEISVSTSLSVNQLRKRAVFTTVGKQFGSAALRLNTIAAGLPTNLVDVTRYDYQDDIFRQSYGTENNLSVGGGTETTKYYASVNYMLNQGIVKNTDFNRYGARIRVEQKMADWLTASIGLNYVSSRSKELPNGNVFYSPLNAINITNNIYNLSDRDGNGNLKAVEPTRINPLSAIETFDITQNTRRTIGDLQLTATPIKDVTISYIFGVDYASQLGKTYLPVAPYDGTALGSFPDGYASTAVATTLLVNNDLNISFNHKFGDFSSQTTAGYSHQYNSVDFALAQGRNLAPGIGTVNGAGTILPASATNPVYEISGFFLQETFGYKDRLFLTLAGRQDKSSIFAADNRSQFYPKASLSYVLSDEPFWKESVGSAVQSLRLRASYGQAGNLTGIGAYDRINRYFGASLVGTVVLRPSEQLANPDVKPERSTETEFGADLGLFNGRIGIGATYYNTEIKDLLVDRVIAPTSGGTGIRTNVGTLTNKGFELSLNANVVRTSDLNINIFGTYSKNKNTVGDVGQAFISISNPSGAPTTLIPGESVGVFYDFYYARNPDGSLLLTTGGLPQRERGVQSSVLAGTPQRDAAGQPSGAFLRKVIGDPNPSDIWSLGSNVTYKNLTLNFLFDAVVGNQVFNADKRTRNNVGIGDLAAEEYLGTKPRGYINAVNPITEYRIDEGAFVKLRELALTYNVPTKNLKGFSGLSVSLIGRNLYSFDNYFSYDPETNAGGQSSVAKGIDFGNSPIPRTLQVALRASF